MSFRFAAVSCIGLATLLALSCAPPPPHVNGVSPTASSPGSRWVPPAAAVTADSDTSLAPVLPAELGIRKGNLDLADFLGLALSRSPDTRVAWANARAAAQNYGAAKGALFPELSLDLTATKLKTAATQGRSAVRQSVYGPSFALTWLLLDFGGRSGSIGAAREALLSSDWTHNAVINDLILRVAGYYYTVAADRALVQAQHATLEEARTNLDAAEERRRNGVATIADVLQARTAVGQALLEAQTDEGNLAISRGQLATSVGMSPLAEFEIDSLAGIGDIGAVSIQIDSLIGTALQQRPDLAAARALAAQSHQQARTAHAQQLPSLSLTGNAGRTYLTDPTRHGDTYTATLGLSIPIFNGFAWTYSARAADALAEAADYRATGVAQQVTLEVYTAYHSLQTATQQVSTARDLFASATQSTEAALGRYKEGVGSLLELLQAQQALASARAQLIGARLNFHTSLMQLAHDAALLDEQGGSSLHISPDSTSGNTR
ncbi:MAG: TolC family protein [Gemmatimonadota bacterium]